MTAQRVIEILRHEIIIPDDDCAREDSMNAIALAIGTLSRHGVPQKPLWKDYPHAEPMNGVKEPFCPMCGRILIDYENDRHDFCPGCGQRIDWSCD